MKKITTLLAGIALSQLAMGQILITGSNLTYTQNFDALDTGFVNSTNLPTGWSIFEYGTSATVTNPGSYKGDDGYSNAGDAYSYGTTGTTERALGSVASGTNIPSYGATFVNNTGVAVTGFNLRYRGEEWRVGGSRLTPDTVYVMYSTSATSLADTASALWTMVPAAMLNTPNLTDTSAGSRNGNAIGFNVIKTAAVTLNVPNGYHVILKWLDKNVVGSDDGLAIDSVSVAFATAGTPTTPSVLVSSVSPANGATGVAPGTSLAVTFTSSIQAGTGNIVIKNETDQTSSTVAVPSSSVTVTGATATISGVTLANGKKYYVTFDSAAFVDNSNKSTGIYDSTIWSFNTASSVVTLDSLNETFDATCLPTGWLTYSVTGVQAWACGATYGVNSTQCMGMNGYVSQVNYANEDWLITPMLDLSNYTNVSLQFQAEKDFGGPDLTVEVSTNYSGAGNPDLATWTALPVDFTATHAAVAFVPLTASLTNYKSQPFFIGFKYISTTDSAARWDVDNVQTIATTGVATVSNKNIQLTVVGASTTSNINLMYTATEDANSMITVLDITGRKVYSENVHVAAGTQRIALTGLNLIGGMYIVKLTSDHSYGVVKTIVQ